SAEDTGYPIVGPPTIAYKLLASWVARVRHLQPCYGAGMSTNVTAPALPFDPIARAAQTWAERIGPATSMSAVTNIMRVPQILQATVDDRLHTHAPHVARY